MAVTLQIEFTFTDEEYALLGRLLASTRPAGAPRNWTHEAPENYILREAWVTLRSKIEHARREYRRRNEQLVAASFDALPVEQQAEKLDQFGLELVGLDVRRISATIPDVVGMTEEEARSSMARAKLFVASVTDEHHSTTPTGSVIRQEPAPGGVVPARITPVSFVLSLGPEQLQ